MITALTRRQREALGWLWNKYGNGGSCHTKENQYYFQRLMEGKFEEAARMRIRTSPECRAAVERIEKDDYSELREDQRKLLNEMEGRDAHDESAIKVETKQNDLGADEVDTQICGPS